MVAGCLQISHSHPLSKSQEAEGNWGCEGKGLEKAGGRTDENYGEGQWLDA